MRLSDGNGGLPFIPRKKGVYAVRVERPVPRVKGSSDLVYFGSSGRNHGVLKRRIESLVYRFYPKGYKAHSHGSHTARRALKRMVEEAGYKPEFAFFPTDSFQQKEKELLQAYVQFHIEPPPLNNTRN